jgi:hypothetical protein
MITSAPPSSGGRRGPPEDSQYRFALSTIQSDTTSMSAELIRSVGSLTPWRILCMFLVILKTPGFGLGTYLTTSMSETACQKRGSPNSYLPRQIHFQEHTQSDQSMSHERYSTTLRRATEECNLCFLSFEGDDKFHHCVPSGRSACCHVVLDTQNGSSETRVDFNFPLVAHLQ